MGQIAEPLNNALDEPDDTFLDIQLLLLAFLHDGGLVEVKAAMGSPCVGVLEEEVEQILNDSGGYVVLVEGVALFPEGQASGGQMFGFHGLAKKGVIGVIAELFEDPSDADEGIPYNPIFCKIRMVGDDVEEDLVESRKGETHEQRFGDAENALIIYQTFNIYVNLKVLF